MPHTRTRSLVNSTFCRLLWGTFWLMAFPGVSLAATWTQVTIAAPTATTFTVTGLGAGIHCYRITAKSAGGDSTPSGSACKTDTVANSSDVLTWTVAPTCTNGTPAPANCPITGFLIETDSAALPNPPALTVAQNTAFKMRQAVDSFSFVSIGTVPLGSACVDTLAVEDSTGRYTPVARNLVTLRNRFDTLPLVVYAHCA